MIDAPFLPLEDEAWDKKHGIFYPKESQGFAAVERGNIFTLAGSYSIARRRD
jgi:hypothetical protein